MYFFFHRLNNVVINIFKLVSKHSLSLDLRKHFRTQCLKGCEILKACHLYECHLYIFLCVEDSGELRHFATADDRR